MDKQVLNKIILVTFVVVLFNICNVGSYTHRPWITSYKNSENRELKKSLGFDENIYLNFTELTSKYGYPTETHEVVTEDGYILTLFRMLPKCNGTIKTSHPVLLYHGIMDSADAFVTPNPKIGLGYAIARNCNDVWLMNSRGNHYSRKHTTLDPDRDVQYWKYSFEEHGRYDIPAIIDYVLNATQTDKVVYVGHSQGTTSFFAMAALRPEYNDKVKVSFQLAPVAWMRHIRSPFPIFLAPQTKDIKELLDKLGYSEILAKHQIFHALTELVCFYSTQLLCELALVISTGHYEGTIKPKTLRIGFGHVVAGGSSRELAHYGQLIKSGRFQRYDLGKEGNLKEYQSPTPPEYDLSKISSPVVLLNGQSDWLSDLKDVDILKSKLPNLLESYVVPDPRWSHFNYLWGIDSPKYIQSKILYYINKTSN